MGRTRLTPLAVGLLLLAPGPSASGQPPSPPPDPLEARADSLIDAGTVADAERLAREQLVLAETRSGPRSLDAARWTRQLADCLFVSRRFAEARRLFEEALAICVEASGPDSLEVAAALCDVGGARLEDGAQDAALECFERARRIHEAAGAPDRPGPRRLEAAVALNGVGKILFNQGKLDEARPLLERALALVEAEAPEHRLIGEHLNDVGGLLYQQGDYAAAERAFARQLAAHERLYGPGHRWVAIAFANLALVDEVHGDYAEAEGRLTRALAIAATYPDSMHTAVYANNLAKILQGRGDLDGAEAAFRRALRIIEQESGTEGSPYIVVSTNLGRLLVEQGRYADAEAKLREVLALSEHALGGKHPTTATVLSSLATLDLHQGDPEGASAFARRALEIRLEVLGPQHFEASKSFATLADIEIERGDPARADSLGRQALAIVESLFGSEHERVAPIVARLGVAASARGDLAAARAHAERAVAIVERALGPEHPETGSNLHLLGDYERKAGEHGPARAHLERALAIRTSALGAGHPLTSATRLALGRLELESGRTTLAWERARAAFQSELALWEDVFALASERKALATAARIGPARDVMLEAALAAAGDGGPARADARTARTYEALLLSRGRVLDHLAARHRSALELGGPETDALLQRLDAMKRRLANLVLAGPGAHPERYVEYLEIAAREKEEAAVALAAALARRSPDRARRGAAVGSVLAAPELRALVASLPRGAALVEYVRFLARSGLRDVAFVLTPDAVLTVVPVGEAAATDSLVGAYRRSIEDPQRGEAAFDEAAERLASRVWTPIEDSLAAGGGSPSDAGSSPATVFLVLDGPLHLVDFDALVGRSGRSLIESWTFHRLTSARDLVLHAPSGAATPEPGSPVRLLAVGDPDFASSAGERRAHLPLLAPAAAPVFRSARPDCRGFDALAPAPLPGTRREVLELGALPGVAATVLLGTDAFEERVKLEAPRHRVVHLATHGYFVHGECPEPGAASAGQRGDRAVAQANPLLLSGLLLAGCKAAPDEGEGAARDGESSRLDDGFLTSEEIAALDLRGVDWVVLSACDTGLGRIEVGEGVLGLGHALELAGARAVVMSLHRIPDALAPALIRDLYAARQAGHGAPAALRQAKLAALARAETEMLSRHPSLWAGLVSTGDWRAGRDAGLR
jgi:tetratricopeptide (TPR) repeat protein/CHAT domain-containing protein